MSRYTESPSVLLNWVLADVVCRIGLTADCAGDNRVHKAAVILAVVVDRPK